MNGLYIERCCVMLPTMDAVKNCSPEMQELVTRIFEELKRLNNELDCNINNDRIHEIIVMTLGVMMKAEDKAAVASAMTDIYMMEEVVMDDFTEMLRIFNASADEQLIIITLAMLMLSAEKQNYKYKYFGQLCQQYFSTPLTRKKYYNFASKRRREMGEQTVQYLEAIGNDAKNQHPLLHSLLSINDHELWNSITHGFHIETVTEWLNTAKSAEEKLQLLDHITDMCKKDIEAKERRFML